MSDLWMDCVGLFAYLGLRLESEPFCLKENPWNRGKTKARVQPLAGKY